ncbi:hypothetical protein N7492_010415 [Penicillium capsulatum]|uniref:Major facilitator superfamily (MFS) profile domain-containing protein n=1 Tax=Penicillium capsulatum TaxID=69766 RepID=A0A9W9LFF3_9EURO|nr:hypothetical protein N7492_010415 [Penicillium capsulatum]KAJ6112919.1 hypothetical protein N7512_008243 [Penicillium capsulatum]
MGYPLISLETFDNDSKLSFDPYSSIYSLDVVRATSPAQESRVHLVEGEQTNNEPPWQPSVRDWLIFCCVIVLAMMDAFDATILIPSLPHLANTFDKPLVLTFWVNTSYLMLSAASQPFFTMMCEVLSQGPVWIIAVVCTTIGTGVCSGSMTLAELIVGRLIQGIGGGGAMSLCFVVMAETVPPTVHSRYSCYILLTRLIGVILGPIVGGLFVDYTHWTWSFYFNFIFCALGLLGIPFAVDLRGSKNIPLGKMRVLDWIGAALAFLGPAGIVVGVSWGGVLYQWTSWQTLLPIAVGAVIFMLLVVYEVKWATHPQFGATVFRTRPMLMTYIGYFCHGFVVFCQLQFLVIYFMTNQYFSSTISAVALLAIGGIAIAPAAVVGTLLAKEPRCTQWLISGGWLITTAAAGCSILLDPTTPIVGWVFLMLSAGLGHGVLLSSYNIRVQELLLDQGGFFSTKPSMMSLYMRSWGMAAAVPTGGVVFLNFFGKELEKIALDAGIINQANGYLLLMEQVQMSDHEREAIKEATALALRVVWEVITGVAAVGGISSAFLWEKKRTSKI